MQRYIVRHKNIGETPLDVIQKYKVAHPEYTDVPMAYAGRLDPMASGKLLILIGDECKQQERYHALDKKYQFEILFGIRSDTQDVLGIVNSCTGDNTHVTLPHLQKTLDTLTGTISLPYPHFSSKTVRGKPLHLWTLEGKLDEIDIPLNTSRVHKLVATSIQTLTLATLYEKVLKKINSIPPVTDPRKELGRDFRRTDVRESWKQIIDTHDPDTQYVVASCTCIASSGTYMRSLAEETAQRLGTCGLAYHIHRTEIGTYQPLPFGLGFWTQKF